MKYYAHRRTSNVDKPLEESALDNAGVVSVDDEDGTASHDEEIARGLVLDEHMANNQSPAPVVSTAVVASTSTSTSTASSKMKLNIHHQDTTQNFRATAASRKREQVTNEISKLMKMINLTFLLHLWL